ncbi:MAG: hypothetical protein VYB80_03125, partial [Actinomycetota bacterium]|nr:hypothetical protein [Actinomycetota bacterium]
SLRSFASDPLPEAGAALVANNSTGTSYSGFVDATSEVFVAVPENSLWNLSVNGIEVEHETSLEWALGFQPEGSGTVVLQHETPSKHRVVIFFQALLWFLVLLGFLRSSVGSERSLL